MDFLPAAGPGPIKMEARRFLRGYLAVAVQLIFIFEPNLKQLQNSGFRKKAVIEIRPGVADLKRHVLM